MGGKKMIQTFSLVCKIPNLWTHDKKRWLGQVVSEACRPSCGMHEFVGLISKYCLWNGLELRLYVFGYVCVRAERSGTCWSPQKCEPVGMVDLIQIYSACVWEEMTKRALMQEDRLLSLIHWASFPLDPPQSWKTRDSPPPHTTFKRGTEP